MFKKQIEEFKGYKQIEERTRIRGKDTFSLIKVFFLF